MHRRHAWAILLAGAVAGACGRQQQPPASPWKPVATTKQIMTSMVIPASDALFNVGAEPPTTDEAWAKVQNDAIVLAESGNLLMVGNRLRDTGDWVKFAQAMIDAGVTSLKAAEAKNVDAISMAGDQIVESCMSCHDKYMPKPAQ